MPIYFSSRLTNPTVGHRIAISSTTDDKAKIPFQPIKHVLSVVTLEKNNVTFNREGDSNSVTSSNSKVAMLVSLPKQKLDFLKSIRESCIKHMQKKQKTFRREEFREVGFVDEAEPNKGKIFITIDEKASARKSNGLLIPVCDIPINSTLTLELSVSGFSILENQKVPCTLAIKVKSITVLKMGDGLKPFELDPESLAFMAEEEKKEQMLRPKEADAEVDTQPDLTLEESKALEEFNPAVKKSKREKTEDESDD